MSKLLTVFILVGLLLSMCFIEIPPKDDVEPIVVVVPEVVVVVPEVVVVEKEEDFPINEEMERMIKEMGGNND